MLLFLVFLYLPQLFALPNQFTTEYIVRVGVLPLLSTVHLTVKQHSQNLFGFSFTVDDQSTLLITFIDGLPCYDSCVHYKRNGENVTLAYAPNTSNFAVFQQSGQQTLFFFEGCSVDLSYCQITPITSGTFCACKNENHCAFAREMELCFTPTNPLQTTTSQRTTTEAVTITTLPSTKLPLSSSTTILSLSTTTKNTSLSTTKVHSISSFIPSVDTTTLSSTTPFSSSKSSPKPTNLLLTTTSSSSSFTRTTKLPSNTQSTCTPKVIPTSSSKVFTTSMEPIQTITETPTNVLKNISDSGITLQNVTQSLNITLTYTEDPNDLSSDDIYFVANILTESANLTGLPEEDAILILQNIDNILNVDESVISESGSQQKFLDVSQLMVINCNSSTISFLNGENFGFAATNYEEESFNGLIDKLSNFELLSGSVQQSSKMNSISVPENIKDNKGIEKVFFTIYRNKKFFNSIKLYRSYNAASTTGADNDDDFPSVCDRQDQLPQAAPVMTATFIDNDGNSISTINGQENMATLRFNVTSLLRPLHGSYQVTWWDEENEYWASNDRCSSKLKDGMVISDCPHLTDFTLIVDSKIDDPNVCDPVLTDITLATNTLSIVSLLFLILIQLSAYIPILAATIFFKKILSTVGNADSIQLLFNIVLVLFYFTFTIFSNQKYSGDACSFMAALSYSLLLCSILLTIFQAQKTVIILFPNVIRRFNKIILRPLSAFTLCFLAPFILSLFLVFFTSFFNRNDGFCWVRPDYVIFATIVPVSVLIFNAILCTILVIWRMVHARTKFSRNGKHHDGQIRAKVVSILVLQVTMGMPWIVQYFTLYTPYTTAWHYIFSIIIGSQGTMLTLIYFYKRRKIYRRSTEGQRRRAETTVIPEIENEEENLQNTFQNYYLANPTI